MEADPALVHQRHPCAFTEMGEQLVIDWIHILGRRLNFGGMINVNERWNLITAAWYERGMNVE